MLIPPSITLGCLFKRMTNVAGFSSQEIGWDEGRPQDLRLIRMRFFVTAVIN